MSIAQEGNSVPNRGHVFTYNDGNNPFSAWDVVQVLPQDVIIRGGRCASFGGRPRLDARGLNLM